MEATALVSVATGVIKPLVSKLAKLLEEEGARLKGVRRSTGFIRDELSTMGATLQILADTEDLDPEMRIWRDGVRELSFDMEDCVDDFMARADHDGSTGIKGFFDKLKKLKPRHEIAIEIEKLKARAMEASERHKRYKIDRAPLVGSSIDPRLHALYVEVGKLVGIENPKEDIIKLFDEASSTQLRVVSIVGPGGIGKTTLANQVYHAMKSEFSCAAFLSVSRKPDMKNVLRNIAERVGVRDYTSNDDEQLLIDRLREYLQEKRYFIVVDDVWDTEAWKIIKAALLNNNNGSRIITTTRNNAVASCCSPQGDYVYRMKPLSFADSKRLLLKRAFGCEDSFCPHLEEVSKHILAKCAGLPLAILTISSLLADQYAVDEWNRVLAAIGSRLAADPNAGNMTKILSLSYIDLPHHLRTCLLYLSIFPEDRTIQKHILISRWIAEGFVHEEVGRSTYEVGERYFNDLINRSLIQPKDVKPGEAEACQVHDIVLDFITCKAAEENFITSFDETNHGLNSDYRVRRLSLKQAKKVTIPTGLIVSHVRSLTIFGNSMEDSLWDSMEDSLLLNFPSLRVLDLGEYQGLQNNHLVNIEKMFLLKYLRLGSSNITELPRQLEELQYIETLDIKHTRIGELPPTISRLQRLARLYVHARTRFPGGLIGQMQSLEELSEFGVSSDEDVLSLQQFAQLTRLRRLTVRFYDGSWNLEDYSSSVGTLISSLSIHYLYILGMDILPAISPVSLESWCPITPCRLRKLQLETYDFVHVPNWMSFLGNLTGLALRIFCMRPEDVAILGSMPTLFHLEVSTKFGYNDRIVIRGFTCLKYLKLRIKSCGTAVQFEAGSAQKLEHLELQFPVHGMKCVNGPCDSGIWRIPALTKVEVTVGSEMQQRDEAIRIVRDLAGPLSISPTICFIEDGFYIHYEDLLTVRERQQAKKEGQEEFEEEHSGVSIHTPTAFICQDMHHELQPSLLGAQPQDSDIHNSEQDETDKGDSSLADTHAPSTLSSNTDASEPAVRPATAMLVPLDIKAETMDSTVSPSAP